MDSVRCCGTPAQIDTNVAQLLQDVKELGTECRTEDAFYCMLCLLWQNNEFVSNVFRRIQFQQCYKITPPASGTISDKHSLNVDWQQSSICTSSNGKNFCRDGWG